MPNAMASSWSDVPGAIATLVQRMHTKEGPPKNPPRFLAIIDFNTPYSRDVLKITEIATCCANIFKHVGTACGHAASMTTPCGPA